MTSTTGTEKERFCLCSVGGRVALHEAQPLASWARTKSAKAFSDGDGCGTVKHQRAYLDRRIICRTACSIDSSSAEDTTEIAPGRCGEGLVKSELQRPSWN